MKKKSTEQIMAEVVAKFVTTDTSGSAFSRNPACRHVYHDKKAEVVVATDSTRLIATKYGYNALAANPYGDEFPNWHKVIPDLDKVPHESIYIQPAKLLEVCKGACKLGKAMQKVGLDGGGDVLVWFRMENGKVVTLSAHLLQDVLEAMECIHLNELTFTGEDSPVVAKSYSTTIVIMPVRWSWYSEKENRRAQRNGRLYINGLTFRMETPEADTWRRAWEAIEEAEERQKKEARQRMVSEAEARIQPCICGGSPVLRWRPDRIFGYPAEDGGEWAVFCQACRTWTKWCATPAEAVDQWNSLQEEEKARLEEDHKRFEEWQGEQQKAKLAEAVAV